MPDDRYSDWVRVEFCEACGAIIKEEKPSCYICDSYITLASERIRGLFSPSDAVKMKGFI